MAISSKRKQNVETNDNELLASLGINIDEILEFAIPTKKPRQDERLIKSVDRVEDKIESLEWSLAQREQQNKFTESILNSLLDNDDMFSSIQLDEDAFEQSRHYCNYCDLSFASSSFLCNHMLDRHVTSAKKRFYCFACSESFEELKQLQNHVEKHCHSNECGLCKKCPSNNVSHSVEEITRLKLLCDFCPYTDTNISSFQIHCLVCTNNPANENYKPTNEGRVCPTCLQVFNSNAYMLKHIQQKHGQENQDAIMKKFVCDECGRRFISNSSLGGHRRVHKKKAAELINKTKLIRPEQRQLNGLVKKPANRAIVNGKNHQQPVAAKKPVQEEVFNATVEDMPDLF